MISAGLQAPNATRLRQGAFALATTLGLVMAAAPSVAGVAILGIGPTAEDTNHSVRSGIHKVQARQDPSARAREQAYIARLEENIRRLTGRIEQLEYEQRGVNRRFDQLVEDLDQRLRTLEEGGVGLTAGAVDGELERAEEAPQESLGSP